jgi:hypothetical protein
MIVKVKYMIKIEKNKMSFENLFCEYRHNIPVIYSSLEGQYDGELYANNDVSADFAFLSTPFDFSFAAGNPRSEDAAEQIHKLLFDELLKARGKKEAIVFCPNEEWYTILDEVFERHNGIKDVRKIFSLNVEKFYKCKEEMNIKQEGITKICYEQENGSSIKYPVCRVFKNDVCVSFCSAFMLGKNHAELDVFTEEEFRGNGYAKLASVTLIAELLAKNIIPDWCTWPYRVESQNLAQAIGFEAQKDVRAYIWVEEACGKL